MGKNFLLSKTLWVNAVAMAAFTVQGFTGFVADPILQAYALAGINALLRIITKQPIVWTTGGNGK